MLEYIEGMNVYPKFDLKMSEVVWLNYTAIDYLSVMFGKLLPKIEPCIRVLFRNPIRYSDVMVLNCQGMSPSTLRGMIGEDICRLTILS